MAKGPSEPTSNTPHKKMTLEEIRADVEGLKEDPRILAMIEEAKTQRTQPMSSAGRFEAQACRTLTSSSGDMPADSTIR